MKIKVEKNKRETPRAFKGYFKEDGGLEFGAYTKSDLMRFIKENPRMPFELKPLLPESNEQRGFFEGGICSLVAYYQEGMDYRNYKDREKVREWLKIEFNGDLIAIGGKSHRIAKSTKNQLNLGFLERVEDWLVEQYNPPMYFFDTNNYKRWHDELLPLGETKTETYIDYLKEINILK
jgi:hypothetical protein